MRRQIVWCAAVVLIGGCSNHGVSGTYIARGSSFVEMLQITQGQDGHLLGTMASTTLKSNGSISTDSTNISGVAAENSLTLVAKSPIPFIPSLNFPGVVSGNTITLTVPNGTTDQFTAGSPSDYQAIVSKLQEQGTSIQQQQQAQASEAAKQQHVADMNAVVDRLNKQLFDYATMVEQPKNTTALAAFHAAHTRTLERFAHGWALEQEHPKGSTPAGQIAAEMGSLQAQLNQYDVMWNEVPSQGRTHIQEFDAAIANSLCRTDAELPNCAQQLVAIQSYQAARVLVLKHAQDIETTLKADNTTVKTMVAKADAYAY